MKAAAFDYHRPESRAEALDMAATLENAKFLAGGQSLVAMLNMRYAIVDHLIDLNRVSELAGIEITDGRLHVGAMTRQRALMADADTARAVPLFAAALDHVGHFQTRNRGTVGGSLGHMDPAAELVALAVLLDAEVEVASRDATRPLAIADYPAAYMTPAIAPEEMITRVSFALPAPGHGWGFHEFAQRHGDFAMAGAAAVVEMSDGIIGRAAVSIFGLGMAAERARAGEDILKGEAPGDELFRAAADTIGDMDAADDAMASADYRRRLAKVMARRALADAARRAGDET